MADDPRPLVLLGCAPRDQSAALRLATALRRAGLNVEIDAEGNRERVDQCAVFLPLVSDNSQTQVAGRFHTSWLRAAQRAEAMADDTAFLLPVVIDKTGKREARVPPVFRSRSWMTVQMWDPTENLVQRVQELLERRAEAQRVAQAEQAAAAAPSAAAVAMARRWLGTLPPWVRRLRIVWVLTLVVLPGGALVWRLLPQHSAVAAAAAPPDQAKVAVPGRADALAAVVPLPAPARTTAATVAAALTEPTRPAEVGPADAGSVPAGNRPIATWTADREVSAGAAKSDWLPTRRARDTAGLVGAGAGGFFADRATADDPVGGTESDHRPLSGFGGGGAPSVGAAATGMNSSGPTDARAGDVGDSRVTSRATSGTDVGANPDPATAAAVRAWDALVQQGDLPAAQAAVRGEGRAHLQQPAWGICAAQVALWSGHPEAAVALLEGEPETWVETPMFRGPKGWWLGVALRAAGRPLAAEAVWRAALAEVRTRLQNTPQDAAAWLVRAQLAAVLHDPDEALAALAQFDDSTEGRAGGRPAEHITVWAELGDYSQALDELTRRFRARTGEWAALRNWLRYDPRWSVLREQAGGAELAARP